MKVRLVILAVVAVGLAAFYLIRPSAPAVGTQTTSGQQDGEERRRLAEMQKLLWERELPGEEPAELPELAINVEVDTSGGKNRLYYYITEAHGYYVESFEVDFYYKPAEATTKDESPYVRTEYINDYVKANETLVGCFEIVPGELRRVGGDIGTSDNWDAEITNHGRAREQNPDPLPLLSEVGKCR